MSILKSLVNFLDNNFLVFLIILVIVVFFALNLVLETVKRDLNTNSKGTKTYKILK